jgi:hypothetical protein
MRLMTRTRNAVGVFADLALVTTFPALSVDRLSLAQAAHLCQRQGLHAPTARDHAHRGSVNFDEGSGPP